MFRITKLLAIFFLILSTNSKAQTKLIDAGDPSIAISKPFESKGTNMYYVPKFYFTTTEKIIAVIPIGGVWHPSCVIQYFDRESGELMGVHEENFEDRSVFVDNAILIDDRIFFFYSEYDKSNVKENFFAKEILYNEIGEVGAETKIVSTTGKVRTNSEFNVHSAGSMTIAHTNSGKFTVVRSKLTNHFLVKYSYTSGKGKNAKNNEEVGFAVFNSDLEKLWEHSITLPFLETEMDLKNYELDSDLNVNMLINHLPKSDLKSGIKVVIHKLDETGNTTSKHLNSAGLCIEDAQFAINKNNDIILAGYYREDSKKPLAGAFTTKLIGGDEFTPVQVFPFKFESIIQYLSMNEKKQQSEKAKFDIGEYGLTNLGASELSFLSDGSVLLTGYNYNVSKSVRTSFHSNSFSPGAGSTFSSNYQNHNGIFLMKFDADLNELAWQSKVPLNSTSSTQHGTTGSFFIQSVFRLLIDNDNVIIVLPESEKNIEIDDHKDIVQIAAPFKSIKIYRVDLSTGDKKRYNFMSDYTVKEQLARAFSTEKIALGDENEIFIELTGDKKTNNLYKIKL